jgi:hypothetical protein
MVPSPDGWAYSAMYPHQRPHSQRKATLRYTLITRLIQTMNGLLDAMLRSLARPVSFFEANTTGLCLASREDV